MKLEIDLAIIAQIAEDKSEENQEFAQYLLTQDSPAIDKIVHRLNTIVTPQISCVECGNCCLRIRPETSYKVLRQFVKEEDIEAFRYLENFACTHLKDKKCTQYKVRPQVCHDFPYLDQDDFASNTVGMLQNYAICPIIFNVLEELKIEMKWTPKSAS